MLAQTFDPRKHGVGGWFLSEKLDGMRCFWDGGLSRGALKESIPWANHAGDARYVVKPHATGLWSRLGNVIHAPDWWLDTLPPIMLDGELWIGPGQGMRQTLMNIIKPIVPDGRWREVKYHVFDMPSPDAIFRDGRINNTNFKKIFKDYREWVDAGRLDFTPSGLTRFESSYKLLSGLELGANAALLEQERLPYQTDAAMNMIYDRLETVCTNDGEGLMLRKPESFWQPKRVNEILKVKKLDDDEGIVTGYITGRETDKGSKLLGMLGALILNYRGQRLELSGFTDAERVLSDPQWAADHPGQECPPEVSSTIFPRGSTVTFRYRGLTRDGIPQEARYYR